jgi:ABC-type Fe3+-hydroxamate transport system substrate-binding protein
MSITEKQAEIRTKQITKTGMSPADAKPILEQISTLTDEEKQTEDLLKQIADQVAHNKETI